jgi:hypothetical protein
MTYFRTPSTAASVEYIEITATTDNSNSLSLVANAFPDSETETFNLANFSGTGYNAGKVRAVYIQCEGSYSPFASVPARHTVRCEFPNGDVIDVWQNMPGPYASTHKQVVRVPIQAGQPSFDLTSSKVDTSGTATTTATILGVDQF